MKVIKHLVRDYRVKLLAQKTISFLPGKLGFWTNEKIVRLTQGYLQEDYYKKRIDKGVQNMYTLQSHKFCFKDACVLEMGTGWHAVDLILFYLFGAEKIFTIDHHCHLDIKVISRVLKVITNENFIDKSEIEDISLWNKRIQNLKNIANEDLTLAVFLETIHGQFFKRTSADITDISLSDKINLWYSESVLHRIPVNSLEESTTHICKNLLADNAYFFHRLDQKDINAQGHVDKSLWKFDYLKYSDFVYDKIITCRFNSQNRLRESDFIQLFKKNGLEILEVQSYIKEEDLDRMKTFIPAPRFETHTLKDMATAASIIIGKNKNV